MVELLSANSVKKDCPYRRFEGIFPDQFPLQNRNAPQQFAVELLQILEETHGSRCWSYLVSVAERVLCRFDAIELDKK